MKAKQSLSVLAGVALAAAGIGSAAATASGAVIIEQPGNHRLRNDTSDYSVGYVFTVNIDPGQKISITALGVYDAANGSTGSEGDGLLDDTNIALREVTLDPQGADSDGRMRYLYAKDGNGNIIAPIIPSKSTDTGSVAVPSGLGSDSFLDAGYRYVTLDTPIILENGKMYEIVAGYSKGNDKYINYNGTAGVNDANYAYIYDPSDDFIIQATAVYSTSGSSSNAAFSLGGGDGRVGDPYSGPNFQYTVVPEPASLALLGLGAAGLLLKRRRR